MGLILFAAILLFLIVGTAHHVVCGLSEWLYIKLGRTDEAHKAMLALIADKMLLLPYCG